MKDEKTNTDGNIGTPFVILTVVFVLLIIVFLFSGFSHGPDKAPGKLDPAFHTPETARGELLKTKSLVGQCFICHMGMLPDPDVIRPMFNHLSIKLNHGKNDRCYNCHLIQDRNLFTPDYGPGIVHQKMEQLCARCHGIIYNDWINGTHGSKRGYWQHPDQFNTQTFSCTHCHDPHMPQFQYKKYTPPPVWPDKFIRMTQVHHTGLSSQNQQLTGKETH